MITCDKITTVNGPIYRRGGVHSPQYPLSILVQVFLVIFCRVLKSNFWQVYKDGHETFVVVESMEEIRSYDTFFSDMNIRVYNRSGRISMISNPGDLEQVCMSIVRKGGF